MCVYPAGDVVFHSNGTAKEATSDQITFTVSDGTQTTGEFTLHFAITLVDDETPTVQALENVTVNENGNVVLALSDLAFTDIDTDDVLLAYTVTSGPSHGSLRDGSTVPITSFTQSDIAGTSVRPFLVFDYWSYDWLDAQFSS